MNHDAATGLLTIGEVARASGLSISALRFYDRQAVFVPAEVDPATGYRWYTPEQLDDAKLLARLRRIALPVAEIATVLARGDPEVTRSVLDHHVANLEEGLAAARAEAGLITERGGTEEAASPPSGRTALTLAAEDLLTGLRTVRHAVGTDPDMPAIHGVFAVGVSGWRGQQGRIRLAATDRRRAAFAEVPALVDGRLRALLPTEFVEAVLQMTPPLSGEVALVLEAGEVSLRAGEQHVLRMPVPEVAFPDLSHAIPKARTSVILESEQVAEHLAEQGVALNQDYMDQALGALDPAEAESGGPVQLRLDLDGPAEPLAIRRAEEPGTFVVVLPIVPDAGR
ncbi:MerR family transcriptional regulator [Nesterenkonia ebinurensis]|uniref:MerR family transcriptional regulator n=1 Tax=Nesterenkonia ebinurensis TaxID=2608252 RepID=UPI001CC67B27|nr:helix-turn-helix domain-containing protein [Nesterenkonia ebinurensis]